MCHNCRSPLEKAAARSTKGKERAHAQNDDGEYLEDEEDDDEASESEGSDA